MARARQPNGRAHYRHQDRLFRSNSPKPLPEDQRWSADALLSVVGTPWDPTPNIDAEDAARLPDPEAHQADIIPKQAEDAPSITRRMYIRRTDVERFGPTPGCAGCRAALLNKTANHSAACRERIEGFLRETDEGKRRVESANYRMAEAFMRESEGISRMAAARTDADARSTEVAPPSTIRESAVGSAPGADEARPPPPPEQEQQASTGQGGGDAETRQSARGAKRVADRDADLGDEPEHVSQRLPDEEAPRGQKREAGGELAPEDQREHVSRRVDDGDEEPMVGAVAMGKKKVRWDSDAEEFRQYAQKSREANNMAVIRQKFGCKHDVSEIYSPPRVVAMARKLGMKGGMSLDLTVPGENGYVWDFSKKSCRDEAMALVTRDKPLFLMMSPECTPYSIIQGINMRTEKGRAKVEAARRKGDIHLRFCVRLAELQMSSGRYFIYEHPQSAASWATPAIQELMAMPGVYRTELDQCEFGLMSTDELGSAPARKPTSLLTNSVEVHRTMGRKCRGGHRHVHLMKGRAKAAAQYPPEFCRALCRGMRRQARVDVGNMMSALIVQDFTDEIGQISHVPEKWQKFWDDISGKELDGKLVREAREEELTVVDQMNVWELRPVSECIRVTGKRPTKVRWADVNKGDADQPNVRSRIVAKDFRLDARPELFAATPPLEFLRYLVARCAASQRTRRPTKLMVQDVKKAYFYAPATRDVYVDLPPERARPGWCAKLNKSLYGTRDAALNWAQAYSGVLEGLGFKKGASSPCAFFHAGWGIRTVVHGDDFLSEGPSENLKKMDREMRKTFSLKTEVLGPDPGDVRAIKVLNRQISWKEGELHWEADPRHIEILAQQLNLTQAKPVKTPGDRAGGSGACGHRDLDEDGFFDGEAADHVDEIIAQQNFEAPEGEQGSNIAEPAPVNAKRWADADSADEDDGEWRKVSTSIGSQRKAELGADGWTQGADGLWTKAFERANRIPKCAMGGMVRLLARDRESGSIIYDSDRTARAQAPSTVFKKPRSIDMIAEVNLAEGSDDGPVAWQDVELDAAGASEYRAASARLNYLALDRPDILFASKECSRRMAAPRNGDWSAIKRIVRYLVGKPRLVWRYPWGESLGFISAFSDSNWAGCQETRKSSSGACFMVGSYPVKARSRTQSTIALSSAEAEFYALVSAASEALGLAAMTSDFGEPLDPYLYADASAAIGIANREGLGKVRHLDTQSLLLQQSLRQKRVKGLNKVAGTENPSDMATKHVEYSALEHQLHLMNCKFLQGRPELAPQVVNYACEDDVNAMSDWGGETVTCGSNLVGEKGALSLARTCPPSSPTIGRFENEVSPQTAPNCRSLAGRHPLRSELRDMHRTSTSDLCTRTSRQSMGAHSEMSMSAKCCWPRSPGADAGRISENSSSERSEPRGGAHLCTSYLHARAISCQHVPFCICECFSP